MINRNVLRALLGVYAILTLLFLWGKIDHELKVRDIQILREEESGIFVPNTGEDGDRTLSFLRLLEKRDLRNVSAVFISPDEIKANPEKIYEILEARRLPVILLEKVKEPDPGELPADYADLPLIRGHRIPADEWVKMTDRKRVMRFRRAIVERNVKVIFLPADAGYIETKLKPEIKPYRISKTLPGNDTFKILGLMGRLLLLLTILMLLLLLNNFIPGRYIVPALLLLLIVSLIFSYSGLLRIFTNGLAIFLVIALVIHGFGMLASRNGGFFKLTGYSLIAGILIYALHSRPEFELYLYRFRGVKAAFLIPLMIVFFQVAVYMISERIDVRRMLPFMGSLFLIGLFILIIRSGNWRILPSSFEDGLREFFEVRLFARPRFKEFLIGHPLLFLVFAKFKKNPRYILLFPFGMIGQVSLVNSFFHFTHPVHVILLSSLWSLIIGVALGFLLKVFSDLIEKGMNRL